MTLLNHSRLYLQRLGYESPPPPTLQTLRDLQLRHVCTFAFESLSTLLRLPVPIDLPSVEQLIARLDSEYRAACQQAQQLQQRWPR